jgi:hypothetical protein
MNEDDNVCIHCIREVLSRVYSNGQRVTFVTTGDGRDIYFDSCSDRDAIYAWLRLEPYIEKALEKYESMNLADVFPRIQYLTN